jgi:hypothetical protein
MGLIGRAHPAHHQLIDDELAHARSPNGEASDRQPSDDDRADDERTDGERT